MSRRVPLLDHAKLSASLQELTKSANSLNTLSDQLNKEVAGAESALNNIGIGLTAYVTTEPSPDDPSDPLQYDFWRIGYEKHAGKWGITIGHLWGHEAFPESEKEETWAFKDAPREHRLKAVEKIPELIDALVKKANEFSADLTASMSFAQALAATLTNSNGSASKK